MKKERDIGKLRNKKQLNVQEQNALTQYSVEQSAVYFRKHKNLPQVLLDYFIIKGINLNRDILTSYNRMHYGGSVEGYYGQWLTHNHRFISYLIFLDETDSHIDLVDEWKDVTDEIKIDAHTKGRGKSYGQLCIDVLSKLNNKD